MPIGYLVSLGDGSLDAGDSISGGSIDFTTDEVLGAGQWTWSGTAGGTTYTNELEPGVYYLATDGNVYFVPDYGSVDTITTATVTSAPSYTAPDGTVTGTAGADVIDTGYTDAEGDSVSSGSDTVFAGAGNDSVVAGAGDDSILGQRGDDTLSGGDGNDTIYGGQGADTIDGGSNLDTIFGGEGTDSIQGGQGSDLIYGGTNADIIEGGAGDDVVYAGLGDDTVTDTLDSRDVIYGGGGNDSINAGGFDDTVYGGSGSDTIEGGAGIDTIIGGSEDDVIYGGADDDILTGDSGTGGTAGSENISWLAEGPAGTSLNGAFVQNTGGMNVEVQVTDDGNATTLAVSGSTQYTEAGEPFATNSSLQLGGGAGPTSTTTFAFEADAGSGLTDTVENVSFRINDIDMSGWQDVITVNAYDADGNATPVTITLGETGTATSDTVSGNTITAGNQADAQSDASGSALIDIAGPVSYIEVIYSNAGTAGQALWITDVHFDTVAANAASGNDQIYGGDGADIIDGEAGNDSLYGGTGADTISGGDGADTIEGGIGDDSIDGGAGVDTIDGGDGVDTLDGGNNSDIIYGGAGDDVIADTGGSLSDDTIYGGSGNDSIDGGTREDTISGDAGDDTIEGGEGTDTLLGGQGADSISGGADADTIYGDSILIDPVDYASPAGSTATNLTVTNQADGPVDLYYIDGTGALVLYATIQPGDTFVQSTFPEHNWVLTDENGQIVELIEGAVDQTVVYGDTGLNDTIDGGTGNDTIDGQFGDDSILGGLGDDEISGGSGNDVIGGYGTEDGNDTIFGGAGDDSLNGGNGTDTVYGGTGDDTITGGSDNDTLFGGEGSDQFFITDDHEGDVITGGEDAGNTDWDSIWFSNFESTQGVTVTATGNEAGTYDFNGTVGTGSFTEIEGLGGTAYDDTINLSADASGMDVFAGTGADTITSGSGDDFIDLGESGGSPDGDADVVVLTDGFGSDAIGNFDAPTPNGDGTFTGIDTFDVTGLTDAGGQPVNTHDVTVTDDGSGNALLTFPNGETITINGVSPATADDPYWLNAVGIPLPDGTVSGTAGNDVIDGSYVDPTDGDRVDSGDEIIPGHGTNDDLIEAGAGDDTIDGGLGSDTVYAGTGADTIYGGADSAPNTIYGEAGNDVAFGGSGTDEIYGGADSDTLDGEAGNDSLYGGTGNDQLIGDAGSDTLFGGDGADTFYGGLDADTIYGGDGNDTAFGAEGNDVMELWLGDDTAYGGADDDYIDGAQGNDVLYGDAGNDTLLAGSDAGEDTLYGGTGNDSLSAGDGNDVLDGGSGDDTQFGSGGDDVFLLADGFGNDTITGGETTETFGDFLDASAVTTDLTLDLSTLQPTNPEMGTLTDGTNTATFEEIEYVFLGTGNDSVTGSSGADQVATNLGQDTINLGAGDDQLDLGQSGGGADGDADVIILQDGSGSDTILNFDAPTPNGDGTFTGIDTFDVTNLNDAGGDPVTVDDVTVTDDGSGNALLTFPNGESVTLVGISPLDANDLNYLNAIGIPFRDGTVEGTAGADTIGASYTGDPDGDMVDAGDAILPGDTGDDDLIYAYGGDDSVYSGAGDDEVYGGTGNDTLQSGAGNSTLYGGADNDTVYSGSGNDTVYGGTGDDVVGASIGSDEVYGGDGNDTMSAGGFAGAGDTLDGGAGNDTITGGLGDDTAFGGTGDDTFNINAGHGTDTITGGEDVSGLDNDTLNLTDTTGPEGVDVTLTADEAGNYDFPVTGGTGTFSEIETFDLTDQNDTFDGIASSQSATVYGGAGQDTIAGTSDGDLVYGGTDADDISGRDGSDEIYGDAGADTLSGGTGNDTLFGGADDDLIYAGTGNDTLDGGAGTDQFSISEGEGTDTVIGGESAGDNDNLVLFETGTQGATVTMTANEAGTYAFDSGNGDGTFSEIETVTMTNQDDTYDGSATTAGMGVVAGAGDDSLLGGSGADTLQGDAGADTFDGGLGDDNLYGGADNDTFVASDNFGNDIVIGGQTGNNYDTLDLSGVTNPVTVVFTGPGAGTVTDTVTGDVITFSEIEQLILTDQADVIDATNNDGYTYIQTRGGDDSYLGSAGDDVVDDEIGVPNGQGADTFFGGAGNDEIWAGTDDDTLYGGTGADTLQGQEGNDSLYGGENTDTLVGESGNDLLDGGQSNDLLDGGTGEDTLYGGTAFDTLYGGDGNDILEGGIANDSVDGGSGDDTILINDNFASDIYATPDVVVGGETGETSGDTLDGSGLTQDVTVTMTGDEAGTVTNGTGTTTFSEIEQIETGSGNDTFVGGAGADSISTNAGDDQLTISDGDSADAGSGDDIITLADTLGGPGATINITGGAGDETTGDTLQLGDLANLNDVLANAVDDGTGSYSGSITLDDGTILNFSEIENIICFTPGTRIATPHGLRNIEDLKVGDFVVTRDHGLQPIRWVEARTVPAVDRFAPVTIRPNVLAGLERDLVVSPQHRVLFQGYRAELLFGESEVLVAAKHLVDGQDVTQDEAEMVTYIHIMFDQHEVIYAEGAPTESFHPGDIGFSAVGDAAREELFAIFPELRADQTAYGNTARRCLKAHEAKLLNV